MRVRLRTRPIRILVVLSITALTLSMTAPTAPAATLLDAGQVEALDVSLVGNTTKTGRQFLRITYAQPPVGDLRWAAPQPADPVRHLVAKSFGSDCIQPVDKWNFNPEPGDVMRGDGTVFS